MKHLKLMGHQPSKELDKKKFFRDYRQCFTCKMEFDGYHNLMNHRKVVHPSNRKCRNFPGSCTWGNECWYLHHEPMDIDQSHVDSVTQWNFNCNICGEGINERSDFMRHKKSKHSETLLDCQSYLRGECTNTSESCWFKHDPNQNRNNLPKQNGIPSKPQVFQKIPENAMPPDQLQTMFQMISALCMKVEQIEKKLQGAAE